MNLGWLVVPVSAGCALPNRLKPEYGYALDSSKSSYVDPGSLGRFGPLACACEGRSRQSRAFSAILPGCSHLSKVHSQKPELPTNRSS